MYKWFRPPRKTGFTPLEVRRPERLSSRFQREGLLMGFTPLEKTADSVYGDRYILDNGLVLPSKYSRGVRSLTGFTLVEILLVIGIIAILASVVIIAINPARQFAQARNSQRKASINAILNAVYQFATDNGGNLPKEISGVPKEICQTGLASSTCDLEGLANLNNLTVDERYIISMPLDPLCPSVCSINGVGYTIATTTGGRIIISAPDAELGETINIKR